MFMELNRVKEDMHIIKVKTGINTPSDSSGPKMILGGNSGIGGAIGMKRDERRYGEMQATSSAGGSSLGGFFEHIP